MSAHASRGLAARGVALFGRLHPTDLDLASGTLTVVVGPNGAGKTSLLHALAGIGAPAGHVRVGERDLAAVPPQERPGVLGYVPASRELAWPLFVLTFLKLTARHATADEVERMLSAFELEALAARRVDSLSTGERTRVLVARASLPCPPVLLLDEPFANLDPLWRLRLSAWLRTQADGGTAILLSAHDLDLAARIADRVLIVNSGALVGDGRWEALGDVVTETFRVRRDTGGWVQAI